MATHTPSSGARTAVRTFVIADVRGYTSFTQSRGDDAAARLAKAFAEIAREGVEAHGGDVIELRGDEALAVFASPRAALRAAVDLQLVFANEVELHPELPLRVGIGIDAGPAVPVEGGYRGAALNLAARLCSKAGAGDVLASAGALELAGAVEGLAVHEALVFEMKGLTEPVRASRIVPAGPEVLAARFEVDGQRPSAPTEVPVGLDTTTPIIGRDREVHRLRWAWRRARRGEGSVLLVRGPPGIGKTRLLAELAASAGHDGARISYTTFLQAADPLIAAVSAAMPSRSLVVLDDVEHSVEAVEDLEPLRHRIAASDGLVVVAVDDSALSPELRAELDRMVDGVLRPGPLSLDDIREIAGLYIGDAADALPASLLESTGGVPRRIHRQVSEWAYAEASRRLGAAASRAAAGRSDLRSVESELAGNVVDLQHIRERARLYDASDGRTVAQRRRHSRGSRRSTSTTRTCSSDASASSRSWSHASRELLSWGSSDRRGAGSLPPCVQDSSRPCAAGCSRTSRPGPSG